MSPLHANPYPSRATRAFARAQVALLLVLSSAIGAAACQAPGSAKTDPKSTESIAPADEPLPNKPTPELALEPIGYFLTEMDARARAWTNLKLGARSAEEMRKLRLLEQEIARRAQERFADVLEELRGGPPKNRAIAALVLGFSGEVSAQQALLVALGDEDAQVVGNALVGLGVLALPDTATAQIAYVLRTHPEGWTRSNAAYALQRIAANARAQQIPLSSEVVESCRLALIDPEPGVRAQAATTLGVLADPSAVAALADLLFDEESLVCVAAARALRAIGQEQLEQKGACARALVQGWERARAERKRALRLELMHLAQTDYGDSTDEWKQWAFRMP